MTIGDALKNGAEALKARPIPSPEREASLLLQHVLKCDAAFLYAHPEHRLGAMESILFKAVIKRRAAYEPFQYIVGKQEFFGRDFAVTPDVLIPRPETEILVEAVFDEFRGRGRFTFCEIGVGSGCISISMLLALPDSTGTGVDMSEAALEITARNAAAHGATERLQLLHSNMFDNIGDSRFNLIVSNPPYVPLREIDSLQEEVRRFEPRLALDGGADGLDTIRKLVNESPNFLNTGGFLFMEIGWDQSERVAALFDRDVWQSVQFLPDLQGIPRISKAMLR